MAEPVSFEGVALANSAVLNALLMFLIQRGVISRDDVAHVIDLSLLTMEELAAVSRPAAAARQHLQMMQQRFAAPDEPAAPPTFPGIG